MIRTISYDDRRLLNIAGDPLISTIIESAAAQCGMGLQYDFWGVFPTRFAKKPLGYILRKGYSMWATVLVPEAAAEMIDFLLFHQSGWVELDPILAQLWGSMGEALYVMQYPEDAMLDFPIIDYREDTPTAVCDCNLGASGILPAQYEPSVVNLHLARRRHVGYSVTHWEDGAVVSAAAVTDTGSRYGEISYVATLPEWEGRGFGRAMVGLCIANLRERGRIPLIACEEKRQSFYEELGFTPLGKTYIMTEDALYPD